MDKKKEQGGGTSTPVPEYDDFSLHFSTLGIFLFFLTKHLTRTKKKFTRVSYRIDSILCTWGGVGSVLFFFFFSTSSRFTDLSDTKLLRVEIASSGVDSTVKARGITCLCGTFKIERKSLRLKRERRFFQRVTSSSRNEKRGFFIIRISHPLDFTDTVEFSRDDRGTFDESSMERKGRIQGNLTSLAKAYEVTMHNTRKKLYLFVSRYYFSLTIAALLCAVVEIT